jgi:hypothetical protein
MNLSQRVTLCGVTITSAIASPGLVSAMLTGLIGLTGMSLTARFAGTGGTTVDAWVQQSGDGGASWFDVANFHFTAAGFAAASLVQSAAAIASLPITDGALASNTLLNSGAVPLFDVWQVKYQSTGVWVSGLLSITAMPRG